MQFCDARPAFRYVRMRFCNERGKFRYSRKSRRYASCVFRYAHNVRTLIFTPKTRFHAKSITGDSFVLLKELSYPPIADDWPHKYTRQQAAYPAPWTRIHKYWPTVSRIDNPYGDRNLLCTCPPVENYQGT